MFEDSDAARLLRQQLGAGLAALESQGFSVGPLEELDDSRFELVLSAPEDPVPAARSLGLTFPEN